MRAKQVNIDFCENQLKYNKIYYKYKTFKRTVNYLM